MIDGVTAGLIGEGETVTFQARQFGLRLRHTSLIEVLRPYSYFRDVMVAGVFRHFEHEHHFAPLNDGTRLRDEVHFSLRWGFFGRLASKLFVRRRLIALLTERNTAIQEVAESEAWRQYLDLESASAAVVPAAGKKPVRQDGKSLLAAAHELSASRRSGT
ncbi:MAG: SRPBCC family protein [Edaphobacter sp.]